MKRVIDLILSCLGLLVAMPLIAGVAALVKLGSPGPVFFRQLRVGQNGNGFSVVKFRTMTVKAGTENGSFDAGSSQRVTRIGKILRKTKLDELPQLWNVLKGDMSLVGPRPEVRKWVEAYPERWERVLRVRPGITDPAAIAFRDEEELLAASADPEQTYRDEILPRKLTMYEQYAANRTLWTDLKVLAGTVAVVLFPKRVQRAARPGDVAAHL